MAAESVSFRISRNAEDLAQTVHALSQRLVKLEQRLGAMELQVDRQVARDPQESISLDNVERLLLDCRTLLDMSEHDMSEQATAGDQAGDGGVDHGVQDDTMATAA